MRTFPLYVRVRRAAIVTRKRRHVDYAILDWAARKDEVLEVGRAGYRRKVQDLWSGSEGALLPSGSRQDSVDHSVIAEIDQDGLLLSHIGPLPLASTIPPEMFVPRHRFDLTIVDHAGALGVRKNFGKDKFSFVTELEAAHHLAQAGCNVPAILDIDFESLSITFSYIVGDVLREALVKEGAILRDRDIGLLPDYERLSSKERREERVRQGRQVLHRVLDADGIERVFDQLKKIHAAGYILHDIKYGNVIIERDSGEPYFIDFDHAMAYPALGKLKNRFLRDGDYHKFNLHFGTEKMTYRRVKRLMKGERPSYLERFYTPISIEGGVRFGSIRDIGVSYGRWHYILKNHLPSLQGKSILDLGTNNGYIALEMLRCGAREVCAIELKEDAIAQGHFVKELVEWTDNAEYNLRYVRDDMKNVPRLHLGRFDLVTALCSLYYLDDETIVKVVRHLSTITDTFIIQCNVDRTILRSDPRIFEKASVEYGDTVLRGNGFPITKIIAPPGYARPLVIGQKD